MANKLLKCPTCGGNVSETARACPHCGERKFAVKQSSGKLKTVLLLAAMFALFFVISHVKDRNSGLTANGVAPSAALTAE